jgi:hypothetical protein
MQDINALLFNLEIKCVINPCPVLVKVGEGISRGSSVCVCVCVCVCVWGEGLY